MEPSPVRLAILIWRQSNATVAWQDTIVPPPAQIHVEPATKRLGRQVFESAGCSNCHSGPFLTNNSVVPTAEIGANLVRSLALQKTEENFASPVIYSFDTVVPLAARPQQLQVPVGNLDESQIDLAWAHHGSGGGYKVPALIGLYWSALYLHDSGVALDKNAESDLGHARNGREKPPGHNTQLTERMFHEQFTGHP